METEYFCGILFCRDQVLRLCDGSLLLVTVLRRAGRDEMLPEVCGIYSQEFRLQFHTAQAGW